MTEQSGIGARRWAVLGVAVAAQATTATFQYGLPFLIPLLQAEQHVTLTAAGVLVVTPVLGLLAGLIAWGAAADRFGERVVLAIGMTGTGAALLVSLAVPGLTGLGVCLAVAGLLSASVNAASGRAVLGWFTARERGLAMGIRQTCTPLGIGLASLVLPPLGEHVGFRASIAFPAVLSLVVALLVLLVVRDPPRPDRATAGNPGSPYRHPALWRVHAASALLVVPQFTAATFGLTYLVSRWGWTPVGAGRLLAVVAVLGAGGRIAAGLWSDRVGSRMRPMRQIAVAATVLLLVWAGGDALGWWVAVAALLVALVVTVTDNGLGFVATAELAGPFWAGRALGVQNTAQNLLALATPPVLAALITAFGYPVALAACALAPALGVLVTPVRGERPLVTRPA